MSRALRILLLLAVMVVFGVGVNRYIASRKSDLSKTAVIPTATHANFGLPGTVYVSQAGQIYALHSDGSFSKLPLPGDGSWMQPHLLPDGTLLVVASNPTYSDLYHVDTGGNVIAQLTHNLVSTSTIQLNHWVFYPTTSDDGSTVYASYDLPKPALNVSYQEDLSIWAGPVAGNPVSKRWTTPDQYTGGDVQPQPLPNGSGLIYSTYAIEPDNHVESTVGFQRRAQVPIVPLTQPSDDCGSPALAPDGITVAMVCTSDTQTAKIEVAHFRNGTLDTPTVVVSDCLCNSPSWAPDGSGLLYLAPGDATGHFQLWWLKGAGTAPAGTPRAVTSGLDLDSLSPAAWSMPAATSSAASPSS